MSDSSPRPRKTPRNTYTTSSGKTIKLNRSLSDRVKAGKEAKAQRKAAYLSSLPKERWKRLLYRLHPKRMYQYWFSRDGAIMALKILGIGLVCAFLLIVGLFAYFRKDLPKIQDLNSGNGGGNIAIYDRTGQTLIFQDYGAFKRIPVSQSGISKYMQEATIAVEDKDFYHEGAFNVKGITRAAINNLRGGSTQGGSTITQQLVKLNEGWTDDHTVSRKVKELILAVELEREYSKDDILTAYLNLAPYSGTDYGVQAAAQDYFHEDASQLTLAQSAMLAAIPKAPGNYSPYSSSNWNSQAGGYNFDENGLIARQQYILDLMAQQGYISQDQANQAKAGSVVVEGAATGTSQLAVYSMPTDHYAGLKAGYAYVVQSVEAELDKEFPAAVVKTGSWKVVTSIDTNLEDLAINTIASNARNLNRYGTDDAAFVAEDNTTGQIVALVGGRDFTTQQYNFATGVRISPGSSIKPYSYAAFINDNNNVGAGSMLEDKEQLLPGYPCGNKATPEADPNNPSPCLFDDTRSNYGNVTLRYALGSSLNIPAVKAFTSTDPTDTSTCNATNFGTCRSKSIAKSVSTIDALMDDPTGYQCYANVARTITEPCTARSGIGNESYTTLADHVNGIASIARMGQAIPQTLIISVTNASGKVIKRFEQPKAKQVVRQDSAYIVTNMAADPGASYLSGSCNTTNCSGMKFHRYKGWQNAIKTGTNQDLDGLMMSWNTKYTAGIWVGNFDRSGWKNGTQPEYMTDPIMKTWMEGAIDDLGNVKPDNWTQPSDIKVLPAYHSNVPFRAESTPPSVDLFPSWYVGKTTATSQTIDKVSGLTATDCTPSGAKETIGGGSASALNVDIYNGGHPNISSGSSSTDTSSGTAEASDNVHACSDDPPIAQITAVNGAPTGGGTLTCPDTGDCAVTVVVEQGTHPLTDPAYANYPGTLKLTVGGQTVQSQPVSSSGTYTLTFTPPAGSTGSIQVTAQVTDSVLYQGSDTQTVGIESTTGSSNNGNANTSPIQSGNGGGRGSGGQNGFPN